MMNEDAVFEEENEEIINYDEIEESFQDQEEKKEMMLSLVPITNNQEENNQMKIFGLKFSL